MLRVLAALMVISSLGCVKATGRLERNRFQHERYPFSVFYVEGGDAAMPLGPAWRIDNLTTDSMGKMYPKKGDAYRVDRAYDLDRDGRIEETRTEAFYDLLLLHTEKDARMWVRSVPLAMVDRDVELSALATRYVEAVRTQGNVAATFGIETVPASARNVELRPLLQRPCGVSKRDAVRMDFEIAKVAGSADNAEWQRASVVLIRAGYVETIASRGLTGSYPVILVLGLSSRPGDFATLEPDFDRLLKQTVLGEVGKGLSMNGESTCGADAPANVIAPADSAGGEVPADIDPATGLQRMPPEE